MIILPFLAAVLSWRMFNLKGMDWRESMLAAFTVMGTLIVLSTETLSFFSAIRFWPLVAFWTAVVVAFAGILYRFGSPVFSVPKMTKLSPAECWILAGGVLIVLITGFIALYAPPNTWDCLSYHLSRVAHWAKNGGVMNYPTNIIRQLVYPPYAEYSILHGYVLTGGDRFANITQWSAMVIAAVGGSLAARELGASRLLQIAAAFLIVTTPIIILQGSGSQTDLVAGAWAVTLTVFTLFFARTGASHWAWLAGAVFALGALTKATVLLIEIPLLVVALAAFRVSVSSKGILLFAAVVFLLLLCGPFYVRLGKIAPSPAQAMALGGDVTMDKHGIAEIVSNILRDTATELTLPVKAANGAIIKLVVVMHRLLGIGVLDPATSYSHGRAFLDFRYIVSEYHMPNVLQTLLIILAGVGFWFVRGKPRIWWLYGGILAVAAIFFYATVKWQPMISRFHIPFFVLALPLAVVIISKLFHRGILWVLLAAVFIIAVEPTIGNSSRSLVSKDSILFLTRQEIYFTDSPKRYPCVAKITRFLAEAGCQDLGLKISNLFDWEYPWMQAMGRLSRVESVNVEGPSSRFAYPLGTFQPCAVVVPRLKEAKGCMFNGRPYRSIGHAGEYNLFLDPTWISTRKEVFKDEISFSEEFEATQTARS
jgi:hypothetical protein